MAGHRRANLVEETEKIERNAFLFLCSESLYLFFRVSRLKSLLRHPSSECKKVKGEKR